MLTTMKVKIGKKYYNIKKTVRSLFLFEKVTERPFSVESVLDNYLLIYCAIVANNENCKLTWDDFLNEVDKDSTLMTRLNQALQDPADKLLPEDKEDDEEDGKEKKG